MLTARSIATARAQLLKTLTGSCSVIVSTDGGYTGKTIVSTTTRACRISLQSGTLESNGRVISYAGAAVLGVTVAVDNNIIIGSKIYRVAHVVETRVDNTTLTWTAYLQEGV